MKIQLDVEATMRAAQRLKAASDGIADCGTEARRLLASVPSGACVSAGAVTTTAAARQAAQAAEDLRTRAVYIWLAEKTGNPVFLGMATIAAPPRFAPSTLDSVGFALGVAGGRAAAWSAIHLNEAQRLGALADDVLVRVAETKLGEVLANGRTDGELAERLAKLAGEEDLLRGDAFKNRQLGAKLKAVGDAMEVAGSVLQFYSGYKGSSAQSEVGKILSGGLSVAFTKNPVLGAFDFATGGAGAASADLYVVGGEEILTAAWHGDSSHLFGPGTQAWHQDNLDGGNGWLMQSYATMGEAASEPAGEWLDDTFYPGFPFDGDGSINWTPW